MTNIDISKLRAVILAREFAAKALPPLAFLALIVYCVVGAIAVNVGAARLFHNPLDNMFPEGAHAFVAVHAAQTGHLYFSYRQQPHIVQSYGPLFYVVSAEIARIARLNVDLTILYVRSASYVCYLACALLVFLICKKLRCSSLLALLAALMMLGLHDCLGWNVTVRPDMMMLLFMLLSLFFALRMDERPWLWCTLSGFAAGIAFLFKQPGASVAIAILIILLLRRELRKSAIFIAAAGFPVAVMLFGLLWHKESFWEQFTSVGKGSWSFVEGLRFLSLCAADITYIVYSLFAILGIAQVFTKENSWQWRLIVSFTLVSGLVGLAGLPQLGSNTNYYIPGLVGCALFLPLAVKFLSGKSYLPIAALLIIPALLFATSSGVTHTRGYVGTFLGPDMSYAPLRPYRMLTDVSLLTMKGRDPDLVDSFAIHSLELTGHWDSAPVVENIRQKQYDLIIFKRTKTKVVFSPHIEVYRSVSYWRGISDFSPAVVSALNENYDVFCASLFSMVLKPRGRQIDLSPDYFTQMFGQQCGTGLANKPPHLILRDNTR